MRLINVRTYGLEEFYDNAIPPYAILSHTWGDQEVLIHDMRDLERAKLRKGFRKIVYACEQAHADHLSYVWVDTCCIDKSSSAELQEAINSMFQWYSRAALCYAYLEDIFSSCLQLSDPDIVRRGPGKMLPRYQYTLHGDDDEFEFWHDAFTGSRWFTRGWTLQELIAPRTLAFFGCDWNLIGIRDRMLESICKATKIDKSVLAREKSVSSVSVANRMAWAANRKTSRVEDRAYSLLGLFDVNMPMLYGEGGRKAFQRLQEEIIRTSNDNSILAWDSGSTRSGALLAESPSDFTTSENVVSWGIPAPLEIASKSFRASLPILKRDNSEDEYLVILNCRRKEDIFSSLALRVRPYHGLNAYYVLGPSGNEDEFSRLSLVDAEHVDITPSKLVEITLGSQTELDIAKPPKICICIAEGSDPAEITETQHYNQAERISLSPRSVVFAPYDINITVTLGALVKFGSGEEVITVIKFRLGPVSRFGQHGVHTWLLNREGGMILNRGGRRLLNREGGRLLNLWDAIGQWNIPVGSTPFPQHASLYVLGKQVTANISDRVILGERVIMASVSMNNCYELP